MKIRVITYVFVVFILTSSFSLWAQGDAKKPNLLFIMTDQQRYDAISFAGLNNVLQTPNIDRIATNGVWFKNAYTQCAVCAPARATIFTGHTVWNTKMFGNGPAYDEPETGIMYMQTFDEILAENGYSCEYYGKWHSPLHHATVYNNLVTPTGSRDIYKSEVSAYRDNFLNDAFPYRESVSPQLEDTYTKRPYNPDPIDLRVQSDYDGDSPGQGDIHGATTIPVDMQISTWEADQAIDAIERLKDNPFSITCSFHHPHPPFLPTIDYLNKFNPEDMPLPENWTDDLTNSPYGKYRADDRYSDPDKLRHFVAEYYALVKEIDDRIGEILDKLDDLGLTDNTYIIFTSDHGEMLGSHSMVSKNNFYEEASHIPLMMKFPGKIIPGTIVETPISQIDLFATILDYMGMNPVESDGTSIRGKIEKTENGEDSYIVTEWLHSLSTKPAHMVLKNGWKLMLPDSSATNVIKALYNLNNDPLELINLIADNTGKETNKEKVIELENCFREWYSKTRGDKKLDIDIKGLGSVNLFPPGGVYKTGQEVTVIVKTYPEWSFDGWSGDIIGKEDSITIIMDSSKKVTATFTGSGDGWVDIIFDNFNDDYGNWNDGGSNCKRSTKNTIEGSHSLNLSNSTESSNSETDNLDLSQFFYVKFGFRCLPYSLEAGENFSLQISTNGGSTYTNVKTWVCGTDFESGNIFTDIVTISNIGLTSETKFRLVSVGNDDDDRAIFDEIWVRAGIETTGTGTNIHIENGNSFYRIYPNPFQSETNFSYQLTQGAEVSLQIYNLYGQKIYTILNNKYQNPGSYSVSWNAENHKVFSGSSGMYFSVFKLINDKGVYRKTNKLSILK